MLHPLFLPVDEPERRPAPPPPHRHGPPPSKGREGKPPPPQGRERGPPPPAAATHLTDASTGRRRRPLLLLYCSTYADDPLYCRARRRRPDMRAREASKFPPPSFTFTPTHRPRNRCLWSFRPWSATTLASQPPPPHDQSSQSIRT